MRKIAVYSGGYDSTLMLADLVANSKDYDKILVISVNHYNTGDAKNRREHESRVLILNKLRNRYPKVTINSVEIDVRVPWDIGDGKNSRGLSQPILWISNIIPFINDDDNVYLGYIRDDQALLHLDSIYGMWKSAMKIQDNKKVGLELPNRYYNKVEVIIKLMQNYPELLEDCISCESHSYDGTHNVCGQCVPCNHLKMALIEIVVNDYSNRQKASELLEKLFNIRVEIHSTLPDEYNYKYGREEIELSDCIEDTEDNSDNTRDLSLMGRLGDNDRDLDLYEIDD